MSRADHESLKNRDGMNECFAIKHAVGGRFYVGTVDRRPVWGSPSCAALFREMEQAEERLRGINEKGEVAEVCSFFSRRPLGPGRSAEGASKKPE